MGNLLSEVWEFLVVGGQLLLLLVEEFGLLWPFCLFLSPAAELALPEQEGEHGRTPLG